jgi:DNA-binding response OmpR family regulator
MRVLIIEAEPLIALSLAAELNHAGHEVFGPTSDVEEALRLACDHPIDLALIDVGIAGEMSGIELARTLNVQCEVPSLLLTTERLNGNAHADAAIGAVFLPFDPADIPQSVLAAASALRGDTQALRNLPNALQLFDPTASPRN